MSEASCPIEPPEDVNPATDGEVAYLRYMLAEVEPWDWDWKPKESASELAKILARLDATESVLAKSQERLAKLDLSDAEIDQLLERWDLTETSMQRKIMAVFSAMAIERSARADAAEARVKELEKGLRYFADIGVESMRGAVDPKWWEKCVIARRLLEGKS